MSSKPTSQEQFLNSSLIDGKERVRISKRQITGQRLWENFQVDFTGFLKWIGVNINTAKSITGNGTAGAPIQLVNDQDAPLDGTAYTKTGGQKGWNLYVGSLVGGNAITVDASDTQNPIINALTPPLMDGVLNQGGGRVTWIQNYDYEGSPSTYVIGGNIYTTGTLPTNMTLAPADATFDRLDTFVLNTSNAWEVLTGTPSANPLEPDVDVTTQLRMAFALVQAGTTQPTLPTENIYLENTEWVTAVSAGTINPASANNPYAGTVDIEGTAVANGQFITFTPTLFPSLILLDSFIFKIRSKASWSAASRLVFQFQNGTTNVGNAVNFGNGSYGFVSATIGAYQNINIPITDFGNIAAATRLRIMKTGTGTIGFYLDNIQMVGNNNVIVTPQVQTDWAAGTGIASILNKSVTRTVAQMQALQAAAAFDPNMWYIISNPQSSFGVLRIRARDASNLERKGTLIKGSLSYDVNYSLDDGVGNDFFTYMRDDVNNNTVSQFFDASAIIGIIPFTGIWNDSIFYGVSPTISNPLKASISSSNFKTCILTLDHNGSADATPISISNCNIHEGCTLQMTARAAGGSVTANSLSVHTGSSVSLTDRCGAGGTVTDNSALIVDDNGADGTTSVASCFINGNTSVTITGISGGIGTIISGCQITGMGMAVIIAGGETYNNKILNKSISTFTGNRTIVGDGAYSFIDSSLIANYNRSFIGVWTVTGAAPRNVTSFTDRDTAFEHEVTFYLESGSSAITFTDNGTDIIMKGGANAVLANTSDYVTFRFVGQVAYEVDRGIY